MHQAETALASDPINTPEIELLMTNLRRKLEVLSPLDEKIVELIPDDALTEEIDRADQCQENVQRVLARLNKALLSDREPTPRVEPIPRVDSTPADPTAGTLPVVDPPSGEGGGPPRTHPTPPATHGSKVKLPKLTLPHFNGSPVRWTAFWDSYESAIHHNEELSNVDKFNYLRSLFEGTAFEAIRGLTLSAANYQEAIDVLKKRFGNRQLIVSKHMEHLLNINPVTSDQDLKGLRKLHNDVEANTRSLKALGIEPESYEAMLASVLLGKLPPDLHLIVGRKITDAELTLKNLREVIEEELTARERTSTPSQTQPRSRNERTPRPTTTTLLSGTQSGPVCSYCQQSHASTECTTVADIKARKEILKSNGRCFNCLRRGHVVRKCRSQNHCQLCRKKHHTSICEGREGHPYTLAQPLAPVTPMLNPDAAPYESTPTTSALCANSIKTVLLQTARARVYNPSIPQTAVEMRVLLDSGSQRSYMTERARRVLNLDPESEQRLSIAAFGSTREDPKVCAVVKIGVELKGYPNLYPSLFVVPMICEPLVGQPISECIKGNRHLASLELADIAEGTSALAVDILIGSDYYWELVTGGVCKGESGPMGIHTKLGWVLSGPVKLNDVGPCHTNLATTHVLLVDAQLDNCLKSFWELENLGIREPEKTSYDEFAESITFNNGRYQVSLPWRQQHKPLPENYQLSLYRLRGLLKRLRQMPDVLQRYNDTIQDQIKMGIVEDVPADNKHSTQVHYLPHHAVIRTDKSTTKMRIVYDASAKSDGNPSLNECLHVGPKFSQKILDILVRFRSHRVAVTADIEKAFLMVSVRESDRDALRFLWAHDAKEDPPKVRPLRFTRVVFGVSSSPFLLNATLEYHLERYRDSHPDLIQLLLGSFYVDDLTTGANSEEEAHSVYVAAKGILKEGGFNLRKFRTNSTQLQQKIDTTETPESVRNPEHSTGESYADATLGTTQPTGPQETKILGVLWNPQTDRFNFSVSDIAQAAPIVEPTKRNVISVAGRFYDPLGFLAPVVLRFKLLFQKLCVSKMDWDQPLTGSLLEEWHSLVSDLQRDILVSIPRCYFDGIEGNPVSLTLCGFCDASTKAYAAVVYLMIKTDGDTKVRFIVAKTRVSPTQGLTIPRLELLSALLLARLITAVSANLESILPPFDLKCYTDSLVALYWIQGTDKDWKPFVNNRVTEIRNCFSPENWSHCPGLSNPADLPSRGLTLLELSVSQLWRQGPPWLYEPGTTRSTQECGKVSVPEECMVEVKSSSRSAHSLLTTHPADTIGSLIKCEDFSSLTRLFRVTAYVLRAVKLFKKAAVHTEKPLSPEELDEAERLWLIHTQTRLKDERNFNMWQKQFDLFLDDKGLIRCRGRLENASLPYSTKYPVFLPRKTHVTMLIVRSAHGRVLRNGTKETLTEIRSKYWIVKGRSLVRTIIHRCVVCKRYEGAPFKTPKPPALPTFRVQEQPPFTYTGVDYAGPLYTRSDRANKVWICLFTCCVTRAVHLELVTDMSTDTFIRCLKRFAARRGMPRKFLSDNGKTFKAAAAFLKRVIKDQTVIDHLSTFGTEWLFNVERAPWWGGVFERMVKSTKRCLRKFIGRARFTLDELHTAVVEVESIINSRPLTYLSASDLDEPLTPSHLMIGRRVVNLPDDLSYCVDLEDGDFSVGQKQLTKRAKHLNLVLNHFWKRWRQEYLAELRESHRSYSQGCSKAPTISVGDVVVVHEESLPRGFWRLGLVKELIKGRDGVPRGATVKLAPKSGKWSLLHRPIQLLYPLEINLEGCGSETGNNPPVADEQEPTGPKESSVDVNVSEKQRETQNEDPPRRPKRASAERSEVKRRLWIKELSEDVRLQ